MSELTQGEIGNAEGGNGTLMKYFCWIGSTGQNAFEAGQTNLP